MAHDLHTLIRLNEWTVDQRRRDLGDVLKSLADLEDGLERLRQELIKEQQIVQSSPEEAGFFYGNYATAVIGRRQRLNDGIVRMENKFPRRGRNWTRPTGIRRSLKSPRSPVISKRPRKKPARNSWKWTNWPYKRTAGNMVRALSTGTTG